MVAAVRRGASLRATARRCGVSLRTVQVWVARAQGQRLDRVDWQNRPPGCRTPVNRTPTAVVDQILTCRDQLRRDSVLGEYGAIAIRRTLQLADTASPPSVRTIGRILLRHGRLDHAHRVRRPPPPPGWHLPAVAHRLAEVDLFDVIEDLKLAGGPRIEVLTGISLHGSLPAAWPLATASTSAILPRLVAHWQAVGCPAYAQFDNDTRFQGPHQHPDVFGRVVRLCLQLQITPVFVPPREFGLQNAIEHFNGLYTAKVWRRFFFDSLADLDQHTIRYLAARRQQLVCRIDHAPPRTPWPTDWHFRPTVLRPGRIIFIRRTTATGQIHLLGHRWSVDPHWCHRLVRAEVDLAQRQITCFALRRRAPEEQPLLQILEYHYPRGDLAE